MTTACALDASAVPAGMTATAVYEAHHKGFRMTVSAGREGKRYQVLEVVGASAERVVEIARAHGIASTDVTILPAQA